MMIRFGNSYLYRFLFVSSLILLLLIGSATSSSHNNKDDKKVVKVRFYGESQCPYCRQFVSKVWPTIWKDLELRKLIDYDFVAWGNAYYPTEECGSGPYNADERHCWYNKCVATDNTNTNDNDDCFTETPIYQHSIKEGQIDIYQTCVKVLYGIETAVDFMYCIESNDKLIVNDKLNAKDVMIQCTPYLSIAAVVQECYETRGIQLEKQNALNTPDHPGVPYILVDDEVIENPFNLKDIICNKIKDNNNSTTTTTTTTIPKTCNTKHNNNNNDNNDDDKQQTIPTTIQLS